MTEEEIKKLQKENEDLKEELKRNKESSVVKELNSTLEKEREEHKKEIEKIKTEKENEKIQCVRAILQGRKVNENEQEKENDTEQDIEEKLVDNIIKGIKGGK